MKHFWMALLFASTAFGYDTYLFRVKIDEARTAISVRSSVRNVGSRGDYQPFFGTYVLLQPDTNYILLKVTPKDSTELAEVATSFGLDRSNLYKIYRITDNGVETILDNSDIYPVDHDWSVVEVSCPTARNP